MPAYAFIRDTLPTPLGYPLKRRALDAALDAAGIVDLELVSFARRRSGDVVLQASFAGERYREVGRSGVSSVTVFAIPSAERRTVEAVLLEEGLPQLVRWLAAAAQAGNVWRGSDHQWSASVRSGRLVIDSSD